MPHFKKSEPDFWRIAPKALAYTQVFAEAVDHKVASFVLGDDDDLEAPLALFMNLPPGWVLSRHGHDCHRFEVVIEGSMIIDGATLYPGDVSTSGRGEEYGPHMAGPEGVLTLEVFSRQAGMLPVRREGRHGDEAMEQLISKLRAGLVSPEAAAADPAIGAWVKAALAEQADLQEVVRQRSAREQLETAEAG